MNAHPANRRHISRAAPVLLVLLGIAILFVGAPASVSAEDPHPPTNARPPNPPSRLQLSPGGSGELVASWRAPYDDGGSAITAYRVQWKSGSEDYDDSGSATRQAVIDDPSELTYTIRGLNDGTDYTVRVIAANAVGDGPPPSNNRPRRNRVLILSPRMKRMAQGWATGRTGFTPGGTATGR